MAYIGSPAAPTIATVSDGTVTSAKLADNSVTSAKIGVDVIVAEDLAANSVTVSELTDGAVTPAKLSTGHPNWDSSGNVGIGTSNPSFKVDLKMSSSARTGGLVIRRSLNDSHQLGLWTDSGEMYFDAITDNVNSAGITVFRRSLNTGASFTESMRIDSSGNVLVRGTSTSNINSSGGWYSTGSGTPYTMTSHASGTASGQPYAYWFYNNTYIGGVLQNGTTGVSYATSSDYRLKENVTEVTDGISRVKLLKPSRFNFIADPDRTVDGFLAHEVSDVVPEAITGTKDEVDADGNPKYQGIDQSKLVPLLTAALQEAITKIESLEARVATLESA